MKKGPDHSVISRLAERVSMTIRLRKAQEDFLATGKKDELVRYRSMTADQKTDFLLERPRQLTDVMLERRRLGIRFKLRRY